MRLSKSLSLQATLRNLVLTGLIAIFYWIGYSVGNHPHLFTQYIDLTQSEVYFYLKDPELLPQPMRDLLLTQSQTRIRFITKDQDISDLWMMDFETLKNTLPAMDTPMNSEWSSVYAKISPDFQLQLLLDKHFLPILWKNENQNIRFYGLWMNNQKPEKVAAMLKIAKVFLSEEYQKAWLNIIDWNTTLLRMDESSLPENRKASAIRKLDLSKIHTD